jgi:hypothetical protein
MDKVKYPTTHKIIFNIKAITLGTALGGPLAAGYLISNNFKTFREDRYFRWTWAIAIIATLICYGISIYLPRYVLKNLPVPVFEGIVTYLAYFFAKRYQGENISKHINNGGNTISLWKVSGIALIISIITFGPLVYYTFTTNPYKNLTIKTYGMLGHEVAYDNSNIAEQEIDKIADALTGLGFFDTAQRKSILVKKNSNVYEISIPLVYGAWNNKEVVLMFERLKNDIHRFIPQNAIVINLCVDGDPIYIKKRIE